MLVGSFLVAKELKIPFYVYMHDLWEDNLSQFFKKRFAKYWEPKILLNARRLICCTEKAQKHYKIKYGIDSEIIPHSIPDKEIDNYLPKAEYKRNDTVTILYSGSISYIMNQDAFKMMSQALDILPDNYKLLWLPITPIDRSVLKKNGITSKKIVQKHVDRKQLKKEARNADILLSPLSHKNCCLDEVMTVFSNKLLGYLVSGTPILVFAPRGCYHNESAKAGGWGHVVENDSAEELAQAILIMTSNNFNKTEMVDYAFKEANKRRASISANIIEVWVNEDAQLKISKIE